MMILLILLCISIMFLVAPFMQGTLYEIDAKYFKKVKIKKFAFMFRGLCGKECIYGDVQEYGVIIPMLVVQISGYFFALASLILFLILYFAVGIELTTIAVIVGSVLGGQIIITLGTTGVCVIITEVKRKKK